MFEVSAEETIALAQHSDLFCTLNREAESSLRQSGVSWTRLAFQKNTDRQHVIQQLPQEQSVAGRLDRSRKSITSSSRRRLSRVINKPSISAQIVRTPQGDHYPFEVSAFRKKCLMDGLDETGLALGYANEIRKFER
jgi:hypothetical protein